MRGLREQVHSHSLNRPEGGALHPVRWGPAEAVVEKERQGQPHGSTGSPVHPVLGAPQAPHLTLTLQSCPWLPGGCKRHTGAA